MNLEKGFGGYVRVFKVRFVFFIKGKWSHIIYHINASSSMCSFLFQLVKKSVHLIAISCLKSGDEGSAVSSKKEHKAGQKSQVNLAVWS